MVNIKLSAVCVMFAVAPALIALGTKHLAPAIEWKPTVPFVTLSDGRRLAYEIRGNPSSQYTAFYIHGTPSCRVEFLGFNQGILDELGIRLIGVDKPGYGQSDPHYGRSLKSFVLDLEELADHLQLQRFLLIGVSGGGPYSWATAKYAPHRVKGVLILSGAGNLGMYCVATLQITTASQAVSESFVSNTHCYAILLQAFLMQKKGHNLMLKSVVYTDGLHTSCTAPIALH